MPSLSDMPDLATLVTRPKWAAIKPYTLDVQQGVVIDEDMIARLKTGMSRTQVGYVLGTPLLADPFHANRWDYVYYTRKKDVLSTVHNLTVFFRDDKLERFQTDYPLPKPAEVATKAPVPADPLAPAVPATKAAPAAPAVPPAASPATAAPPAAATTGTEVETLPAATHPVTGTH